jgi:hypothetical protein
VTGVPTVAAGGRGFDAGEKVSCREAVRHRQDARPDADRARLAGRQDAAVPANSCSTSTTRPPASTCSLAQESPAVSSPGPRTSLRRPWRSSYIEP